MPPSRRSTKTCPLAMLRDVAATGCKNVVGFRVKDLGSCMEFTHNDDRLGVCHCALCSLTQEHCFGEAKDSQNSAYTLNPQTEKSREGGSGRSSEGGEGWGGLGICMCHKCIYLLIYDYMLYRLCICTYNVSRSLMLHVSVCVCVFICARFAIVVRFCCCLLICFVISFVISLLRSLFLTLSDRQVDRWKDKRRV